MRVRCGLWIFATVIWNCGLCVGFAFGIVHNGFNRVFKFANSYLRVWLRVFAWLEAPNRHRSFVFFLFVFSYVLLVLFFLYFPLAFLRKCLGKRRVIRTSGIMRRKQFSFKSLITTWHAIPVDILHLQRSKAGPRSLTLRMEGFLHTA